jgi:hypothetical protein
VARTNKATREITIMNTGEAQQQMSQQQQQQVVNNVVSFQQTP